MADFGKSIINNIDIELARLSMDYALTFYEETERNITEAQKEAFKAGFWACYQAMER